MITIFNQKKLFIDSDPIELARVKSLLNKSNIKYSVKTVTSRGAMGRRIDVGIYSRNLQSYGAELTHVYYLYVRKKDYIKAKDVISGG